MHLSTKLISVNRTSRTFIFSILALTAPYYLSDLGISPIYVAILIMISGISSTVFVYGFSRLAIPDRPKLLLLSALLTISLLMLFIFHNLFLYIFAIIVGGIPLSGRDFTHNQAIEQYSISMNEQERKDKSIAFSIYNFGSYASAAVASASIYFFYDGNISIFYEVCFVLSLSQFATYSLALLPFREVRKAKRNFGLVKNPDVPPLSILFSIDSLGGGLVLTSMITLWFKIVYNVSLTQIGFIFIVVNIVTAVSIILSSVISNRMGLVKTMVYTHIVSNIFLVLIPLINSLLAAQILLYLRQTTSQMDVPARDSFINTLIPQEQRTSTNARFIMIRNLFQIPGPAIGGAILDLYPPLLFVVAGGTKIMYDILFYARFRRTNL